MGSTLVRVERQYYFYKCPNLRFHDTPQVQENNIRRYFPTTPVPRSYKSWVILLLLYKLDPSAGRASSKRQGLFGSDNSFRSFTGPLAKRDYPLALGLTPSNGFPNP